jgi:N-6 DNA Methylase
MDRAKEIAKLLGSAGYRHDRYALFSDCMAAMAYTISNSADLPHREEREAKYMEIVGRYNDDLVIVRETFPRVLAEVTMALQDKPQDVLGRAFGEMEIANKDRGQSFTPYDLSALIAQQTVADGEFAKKIVADRGFIRALEPTVGSGGMVVALAEVLKDNGVNYQQELHVTAVDTDERAVHMAYVQCSLMHIPAAIYVGDSLMNEMRDVYFTPAHCFGLWSHRIRAREAADGAKELMTAKPAPKHDLVKGQYVQPDLFSEQQGGSIKPLGL